MSEHCELRDAQCADWPGIEALLQAGALPLEGVRAHLENFIVGESSGTLYCVAGFEFYGQSALLRSVAVSASMRGAGVGARLLEAIKSRARQRGIVTLYLLTTSATRFFAQRGFTCIERSDKPVALQASSQFQGICPASATVMVAHLD